MSVQLCHIYKGGDLLCQITDAIENAYTASVVANLVFNGQTGVAC